MRVEIYKGGELAAVLVYGRPPIYSGTWGDQARKVIEHVHYVRNRWTGEVRNAPPTDSPDWWLSTIYSAGWAGKDFTVFGPRTPEDATPVLAPPRAEAADSSDPGTGG
jgi:hypothetical protein